MVRMIPPKLKAGAPDSEKAVYELLKTSALTARWTVYHSEFVKNPRSEARAYEIDFLVVIPECYAVVCVEAKGGRFRVVPEKGQWVNVRTGRSILPPPEQARRSMHSLSNEFSELRRLDSEESNPPQTLISYSCAVALPDANYPRRARRPKEALILEQRHMRDADAFANRLLEFAESASTYSMKRTLESEMGMFSAEQELDAIHEYMENNLTITMRPETITRRDLDSLKPRLLRLTEEQILGLSAPDLNDRCVIDGAAGTGKTVLAQELARRHCEVKGNTVAMLCSNPVLASRLMRWAETLDGSKGGRVLVGTPASLPGLAFEIAGDEDAQVMHELRYEAAPGVEESLKFGYLHDNWKCFIEGTLQDIPRGGVSDYLIVDEAQNMCDDLFLNLMDGLLKGGLSSGQWTMFGDFTNQNIVSPGMDMDAKEKLKARGIFYANSILTTNCRNTEDIAFEINRLVDIDAPAMSGVYGPEVEFAYFASQDQLSSVLDRIIGNWKRKSIQSRQIILLSTENSQAFDSSRAYGGWQLVNIVEHEDGLTGEHNETLNVGSDRVRGLVRYSDLYDFQGLESDVAILVLPLAESMVVVGGENTKPNPLHLDRMLYIGMSRAKVMLIVVAHESYKASIDMRISSFDLLKEARDQ